MSKKPTIPPILEKTPEPTVVTRLYHGRSVQMWEGMAKIANIEGWAKNPRITLAREKWEQQFGRLPDQDEVFDIMKKDKDIKLDLLRTNIQSNGLRNPLVLTYDGRLLDGNRRFFAIRAALETLKKDDPRYYKLETVPVYMLTKESTEDEQRHILVEENFAPSLKLDWPDYVKARHIREARDAGVKPEVIAADFGWDGTKVRETLRTLTIVDDFLSYATSPPDSEAENEGTLGLTQIEAEDFVAKRYQFFNEAQKSFFNQLEQDPDFKVTFFHWLHKGCFSSFPQARVAHKAYQNLEAKSILDNQSTNAGKDAKTVVDDEARMIQDARGASHKIRTFVRFLRNLKAQNIGALPDEAVNELREALKLVENMARSVND